MTISAPGAANAVSPAGPMVFSELNVAVRAASSSCTACCSVIALAPRIMLQNGWCLLNFLGVFRGTKEAECADGLVERYNPGSKPVFVGTMSGHSAVDRLLQVWEYTSSSTSF